MSNGVSGINGGAEGASGLSPRQVLDRFTEVFLESGDIVEAIAAVDPAEADAYRVGLRLQAHEQGRKDAMGYAPNLAAVYLRHSSAFPNLD